MSYLSNPAFKWYFRAFNFVAQNRLKKNDIDGRDIHTQLVAVFSTGLLMWAYVFVAYFFIASPIPWMVGFICATVHLFSPLLFRFTHKTFIPTYIMLLAGIVHQATFSFFTGGFDSSTITWFGILPMIGGIVYGRRGALTWSVISIFVAAVFCGLKLNGYNFPDLISSEGRFWGKTLLVFGWIFLSTVIVTVYAELRVYTENKLQDQGKKIDDLFRVLFHDLANPLSRVAIGLSIAKKDLPLSQNNRGLEIAQLASESMIEITQNVRNMYAVSKGKANVDLMMTSLNSAVEYIIKLYAAESERKKIKITYNFEKNEGLHVLVEPVSFNNQVLGNIISNAIKFSPKGRDIFMTVYPVTNDTYKIEVKDNGIGIPESIVKNLFDINKRTTRAGTSGESGSGFGMHIMKSFVDMYGGQLLVESTEGKDDSPSGTTVKLLLKGKWI
jgi:signal transduction histidine kinase